MPKQEVFIINRAIKVNDAQFEKVENAFRMRERHN